MFFCIGQSPHQFLSSTNIPLFPQRQPWQRVSGTRMVSTENVLRLLRDERASCSRKGTRNYKVTVIAQAHSLFSRKTQHQFHRNWKPTSYYTHTGTSSMENSTWASHYLAPTLAPPAINWPLKCDHPRARKKKNLKKNSRNITNLPNLHLQCVKTTRHAWWGAGLESPVQLALQE